LHAAHSPFGALNRWGFRLRQ